MAKMKELLIEQQEGFCPHWQEIEQEEDYTYMVTSEYCTKIDAKCSCSADPAKCDLIDDYEPKQYATANWLTEKQRKSIIGGAE